MAATILEFRRQLDRQGAVFADLVVAGHRRGVGREDGYESTPSWLRARSGTMASLGAAIVIDWATFLAHLNREAFVRFGQMDGGFIGGLDPSDVETLLCDCTLSSARRSLGASPEA